MKRALIALSVVIACNAGAQTHEITPLAGLQTGGAIELNGEDTPLDAAFVAGLTLSFDRGPGRKLDFLVTHQQTRAVLADPFEPVFTADVSVTTFQAGGRYMIHPDARTRPYVAATVGGTWIGVNGTGALTGSGALGAGADVQLTPAIALRLDGRFNVTLMGSGVDFGCNSSGACAGTANGSSFSQFTATTGLVFRF